MTGADNGNFVVMDEMATLDGSNAETAAPVASRLEAARSYRFRQYPLVTAAPEGWRR